MYDASPQAQAVNSSLTLLDLGQDPAAGFSGPLGGSRGRRGQVSLSLCIVGFPMEGSMEGLQLRID